MKNILFLIMLMPLFTVGQNAIPTDGKATPAYFRIDSNGVLIGAYSSGGQPFHNYNKKDTPVIRTITTDSIAHSLWSGVQLPTWKGSPFYTHPEITTDTIKVKALVTTGNNVIPFEVELFEVIERGWYGVTLAKYLTTDKKPLPKTTTVWMAKPIN